MSKFNFKNHEVYYDVQGEGEPLVILNGIMMSTKSWEYLVPPVSKVCKLIRVDFFDQGQSDDYLDEVYTQDLQAELVLALLDHLNIEKTYIMGLSYGGEVAIKFALKHQERLLGLILSNTTSKTNEWLRDIGRGWNGIGEKLDGETYYNIAIPVIYSPGFYQKHNDWMENRRKLLVPLFKDPHFQGRMKRLVTSAESLNEKANVHKITVPTLIISSEYDFLTPKEEQEFLHKEIKGSSYVYIPNLGHGFMYEDTKLFISLVIGFVLSGETSIL